MAGALRNTGFREDDPNDESDPSNYGVMDNDPSYDPASDAQFDNAPDDSTPQDTVDSSNAEDQQDNQAPPPPMGALNAQQRARMESEATRLESEAGASEASALSQQQARANAIRDALRSSRMKLVGEHPDRKAMWLAVSAALGAPTRGFGIGASMAQGAAAAVPYMDQESRNKTAREDQISKYDEALAQYGQGPNAISSDVINTNMKLAELKRRTAQALEVAASKGAGAAGPSTALGKLIAERDALAPNDPSRKLYDRQIALLQKTAGGTGETPIPGDVTKTGEEYLATIPADMRGTVKALAEGRRPLPNSRTLDKDPYQRRVMAALEQYDPSMADAANAPARMATRKDFAGGGKSAIKVTAIGTALHHMGSLKDAYAQLDNTRFDWVNAGANWLEDKSGNQNTQAALAKVRASIESVTHELPNVLRSVGMSEKDIDGWKAQFSTSSTPATIKAAVDQIVEIMEARLMELGEQYNTGMGTSREPMTLMKPEDQKIYAKLTGRPPPFTGVPGRGTGPSGDRGAPSESGQETSAQRAKRMGI